MSNQIAVGQCSTEEDLDIEWSFASGFDPTGRTFEVLVKERNSTTVKTTLTVGSGLTIVGSAVKAKVAKATMAAWVRTEYSTDLVDKTGGTPKRLVPTRITFDEPGKLVGGVTGNSFQVTMAGNRFVVTATRGETGPVGPATTLTIGTVTDIAPGNPPSASLTGPAGAQVLSLGLVRGTPGAGAPNSADILAIARRSDLIADLHAIGITETPSLILDFIDDVIFADRIYLGASMLDLVAALPGSSNIRSSTATYFGSDGLMKTAAANAPRLSYDPLTRRRRGFLAEPYRENLIPFSKDLSAASLDNAVRTANVSASPDGTLTMSRVTSTAGGVPNTCFAQMLVTVPNDAVTRTYSAFLRQGTSPTTGIDLAYAGSSYIHAHATIDWATKSISGTGRPRLVDCGGGLYRASVTLPNNASGNDLAVARVYVRGNGSGNVVGEYVDTGCWQLEPGGAPTSYIPTDVSAVARDVDYMALTMGALLGSGAGTVLFEADRLHDTAATGSPAVLYSNDYNWIGLSPNDTSDESLSAVIASGGAFLSPQFLAAAPTTPIRSAMSWGGGSSSAVFNGGTVGTVALPAPPLTVMRVGGHIYNAWGGHVRMVLYFRERLTDTKIKALSALNWRTP